MGSGIGGANGLSVANAEDYVVAIMGGGAMQMYGMELLVAVKYKLPILAKAAFDNAETEGLRALGVRFYSIIS